MSAAGRTHELTLPDGRTITVRLLGASPATSGKDATPSVRVEIDGDEVAFDPAGVAASLSARIVDRQLLVSHPDFQAACDWREVSRQRSDTGGAGRQATDLKAPFPGKVVKVLVDPPVDVESGTPLIVLEAMKMEFTYTAPSALRIEKALVKEGDVLPKGAPFFQHGAAD